MSDLFVFGFCVPVLSDTVSNSAVLFFVQTRAFGVVARATTGEAWQNIVYSLYNKIDGCDDSFTLSEQNAYQANLTFDELAELSFKDDFGVSVFFLFANECLRQGRRVSLTVILI